MKHEDETVRFNLRCTASYTLSGVVGYSGAVSSRTAMAELTGAASSGGCELAAGQPET